jgi:hypothetical protein
MVTLSRVSGFVLANPETEEESASMIRRVIVVLPDPVPPQIPMMSGRLSDA